ncbi:YunG family protein [Desulfopila aestuarii]|uniref:YunG family protein n=1 Tax=Desulfopila aestuarii TaxID=231440 RepID=UPI000935BA08|nr:hypothetical protein [Desulfopila aestuarii]
MNYQRIVSALYQSWSQESSSRYDRCNPSKGQCSVTAIVVKREFGGTVLRTCIGGHWHYYNRINGKIFDFTSSQFDEKIEYDNLESSIEDALTDCDEQQVAALTIRFKNFYNEI